ncbi:hypothetical protein [Pelagovum pacificum]|uniref:Uncharacterized protein n=1 Tax=Pelagovum pacificum TaxID=2588711 RepID=A0A5C5GF78_9RHOB|nr:hypothetical protein [Pelagovum pacificum]QQA43448.1 hypothetical protein I8N54_02410 [Pelagovum pacificum]TNY33415.1 hypothetical protein FHY64_09120 [Pelagovum pacificum]
MTLVAFAPATVAAQDRCDPEAIVSMADDILALRSEIEGVSARRGATTAAYLKIRYDEMSDDAAQEMLAELEASDLVEAPILAQALAVTRDGPRDGLARFGDPIELLTAAQPSVKRAALAYDDGAEYFEMVAEIRADPALNETFNRTDYSGLRTASLVYDLDDARRQAIAKQAEASGELVTALHLYASLADRAPFDDFLDRQADNEAMGVFGTPMAIRTSLVDVLRGPEPLLASPDASEEEQSRYAMERAVIRAAMLTPEASYLTTLYNQSGELEAVNEAATAYLDALEAGEIDGAEDAWLTQLDALIEAQSSDWAYNLLRAFQFPPGEIRHYAGFASDTLDYARAARQATAPLSGEEVQAPDLLSETEQWSDWLTAVGIAFERSEPADQDEGRRVVELLFDSGQVTEAMDYAEAHLDPETRWPVLRDLLVRYDLQCDGHTAYPGGSLLTGGRVLYRF